jgi:hypothetical protein
MFETVDQMDWKNLGSHVYNRHEQIPDAIRDLLSQEPQARQDARDFLLGSGQDFGDIYNTTPYIIPFLVEILASPDAPDKALLLFHLSGVAEHIGYQKSPSIRLLRLRLQTYNAFKAGLDTLIALLADPSQDVRSASAELLGYMTEEVKILIPELNRRFLEEHEEEVQVTMMRCIKRLLNSLELRDYAIMNQYAPFFKEVVEGHPSHKVRVAAARAAVELVSQYKQKQDNLSPQMPTILAQEFLELSSPFDHQEAGDKSYHAEMVAKDLSRLSPEPILNLLQDSAISAEQGHLLARALLANVILQGKSIEAHWDHFPNYEKRAEGLFYLQNYSVPHLLQQPYHGKNRFLQAIVAADKIWEIPTNLFSFFYGLPDSRQALQALLEASSKS